MSKIRRICLYGGAGCGKSTNATRITTDLKIRGYNVEYVDEYIKVWAYEQKKPKSWDQLYVFAKQLNKEDVILRNNVDVIISDSPLVMNTAYSSYYGFIGSGEILSLAHKFEDKYPSLNFFLHRKFDYVDNGRFQNEEESKKLDFYIMELMRKELPPSRTYLDDMSYGQMLDIIIGLI